MEGELEELVSKWIEYFEEVFDKDWEYTTSELSVGLFPNSKKKTPEQIAQEKQEAEEFKKRVAEIFGVPQSTANKASDTAKDERDSFIYPQCVGSSPFQDWGNAEGMVSYYLKIRKILNKSTLNTVQLNKKMQALLSFIEYFEQVLDRDWEHTTRHILGTRESAIENMTDQDYKECCRMKENFITMFGGDSLDLAEDIAKYEKPDRKATFLNPKCDLSEYWPQGEMLLKAYRGIKESWN